MHDSYIFLSGYHTAEKLPQFQHSEIIASHPLAMAFLIEMQYNANEQTRSRVNEYIENNLKYSGLLKKMRDGYLKHKDDLLKTYNQQEMIDHATQCKLTEYLEKRYLNYKNKDGFYFY